jgi:hypothetical protein
MKSGGLIFWPAIDLRDIALNRLKSYGQRISWRSTLHRDG